MLQPDYRDLAAGAATVLTGLGFMVVSAGYGLGQLSRMGPGYFPFAVGAILVALGMAMLIPALRRGGAFPRPEWRALLLNAGSILLFAAMVRPFGLLPAVMATALLCSLADPSTRPAPALVLAAGITLAIGVVFLALLRLPLPALRSPF